MGFTDVIVRHLADDQAEVLRSYERRLARACGRTCSTLESGKMRVWNPDVDRRRRRARRRSSRRSREEPRYALDTEFHGERSYWPRLALVQIAWQRRASRSSTRSRSTPRRSRRCSRARACMVAHAAEQDLAILERAVRTTARRSCSTRRSRPGSSGSASPSLVALVERLLGVRLGKGDRLTDWTRRPLRAEQRTYAAADVEHLLALHDALVERLEADRAGSSGRSTSARTGASASARGPNPKSRGGASRARASCAARSRGVAQEVAAWRERTAEPLDVPPRYVLSDLALAGIVQRPPRTREELAGDPRRRQPLDASDGTADATPRARSQAGLDARAGASCGCPSPTASTAASRRRSP